MTDWSEWEYRETYCGCKIYRSDIYGDYVYGSPCITGYYWTKAAVTKRIEAGGYCNGTPPPPEEPVDVIEINLPDELTEGSYITGYYRIKNIGAINYRVKGILTTEWNGKQSKTEADLRPNDVLRVNLYEGGLVMPNQDAVITIDAQYLKDGVWITGDTKTH